MRGAVRGITAASLLVYLLAGCAAGPKYKSTAMAASPVAPAPPPLEQSVFNKDPDGHLSEEDIQKILESPLEADFPGRVGVLPIVTAKDWRGPGPNWQGVPVGVGAFVKALRGSNDFLMITEVMPIPSGALGMEALREVAARYKLRYLILYREEIKHYERQNGWTWGYGTLVGALFLPGQTLYADGYTEASMFDVKTGVFLFTVRRRVTASVDANVWHNTDKVARLHVNLSNKAAPDLAKDVKAATTNYQESAKIENERLAQKWQERQERLEQERLRKEQEQPAATPPPVDPQNAATTPAAPVQ